MQEGEVGRGWWRKAGLGAILGLLVIAAAASCSRGRESEFHAMDALALCDNAIKSTSINPKAVEIPYRSGARSGALFVFYWEKGGDGILMPNQYGGMFEVDAACEVDPDAERVVHLEVNGRALTAK